VPASARTYGDLVESHLSAAEHRLDWPLRADSVLPLLGDWAGREIAALDRHPSFVGNDTSPVEFSFTFARAGARSRVLFEPVDLTAEVGRERAEHLRRLSRAGASLERFDRISDLFLPERFRPEDPSSPEVGVSPFLLMHAIEAGSRPLHKVYLNPAATGRPPAEVVETAMHRLGLAAEWAALVRGIGPARWGTPAQEPALFALDLSDCGQARVKVYLRHPDGEEIERVARLGRDHAPGLYPEILRTVFPPPPGRPAKLPLTCTAFRAGEAAPMVTLYCPLDPNLPDDGVALGQIGKLLIDADIDPTAFQGLADLICGPEPDTSHRLSWVGYKQPLDPVVTLYAGLDGTARPDEGKPGA
jgi:hypothetical protein